MERKLGMLSYAPKSLVPLYNGEGPNRFWNFMQSRLKQNIVSACYNDALTDEQISLETGVPLAYLDEEIAALVDRRILVREGRRCKANVILLTSDCAAEIARGAVETQEKIADAMGDFLETRLQAFREIGFARRGLFRRLAPLAALDVPPARRACRSRRRGNAAAADRLGRARLSVAGRAGGGRRVQLFRFAG